MTRTQALRLVSLPAALGAMAGILLLLPILHSTAAESMCPKVDDAILSCKTQGQDYQLNTRPDGCSIAECIAPGTCPVFAAEVRNCRLSGYDYKIFWDERQCRRAQCVPLVVSSESGACPMTWEDAQKKIKNCESDSTFKAQISQTPTCLVFLGCQRVQPTPGANGEVACRKRVQNGCTMIKCDDGFSWNSCEGTGGTTSVSSSASSPVSSTDPCLSIQQQAKEADELYRIKKRDTDLRNKRNSLNQQLRQCRLKNKVK